MPKPTVEITQIEFKVVEDVRGAEARGYLRVSRGLLVQFDVILLPEDLAALEPVLESIDRRVRATIEKAVKKPMTNTWDGAPG